MNRLSQIHKNGIAGKVTRMVVLSMVSILIAACSKGDGVQIGNGQTPDPVIVDFPIAYIKSPLPTDDNGIFQQQDLREQITFDFGADLFYRDRAAVGALPVNITERESMGGLAAIRNVEIDYDGSRLLFSMRVPFEEGVDVEDQIATWNIWQYTFETDELIRVISTPLSAEIGHDIMPKYLPDGRIIFSSTRQHQSQGLLLDEGKQGFPAQDEDDNEFAFNLHVMDDNGANLHQVTFNQSHDLDPSVLANGQIVYSRWDHNESNNAINLYRMNPDGSNQELLYGQQSHDTGANGETIQFMQPRQVEDGRIMVLARPFTNTEGGGELLFVDTPQYLENTQPTKDNIGLAGPAQQDATVNNVLTEPGVPSPGGRYFSVYPIQDGTSRLMVSWTQCRLVEILADDGDPDTIDEQIGACTDEDLLNVLVIDPNDPTPPTPVEGDFVVAPPLYGIWIYDPRDDTQLPIVAGEEGFMFTEVVSADPRLRPPVVRNGANNFALDGSLFDKGEAVLNIRNVYDFDGAMLPGINPMVLADPLQTLATDRPARFLRIEKAVSQPEDDVRDIDNTAFGVTTAFGMKEIVGYAMIEPDGSVITKVPANAALMISMVDENAMRLPFSRRHRNWISVAPGQELECNGCHDSNSGLSHGRMDAFDSAYAGAAVAGGPFLPGTDPQMSVFDVGETMADVRARFTCPTPADCSGPDSSVLPSMDVIYRDVWSANPLDVNGNPINPDIRYRYRDLTTASPTSLPCMTDWSWRCRSVINYETIIHPLWSQPRLIFDANGDQVFNPDGSPASNNCLNCHTPVDPVLMVPRVPAGQLDLLTDNPRDVAEQHSVYRELLVTDNLQVLDLVSGMVIDATVVIQDADGNDILVNIPYAPPARAGNARASSDFFDRFNDPNDQDHFNIFSKAEQRLVAEWLDIGAQYYNNPFDAPAN